VVAVLGVLTGPAAGAGDASGHVLGQAERFAALDVRERTLANGLVVLTLRRGTVPWCGLALVLPGGARTDPVGQSGLAHLAEHLLFETGASAGGATDPDHATERLGARVNAFTLADYTVLVEEFSPAVLDRALDLLVTRLGRPAFGVDELVREKRVVADERRFRVEEPPLGQAEELLATWTWHHHPAGRPVLGLPAEVDGLDGGSVRRWLRSHVRPEGAVVAVVCPRDAEDTAARVTRALGRWQAGGGPGRWAAAAPPVAPEGAAPAPAVLVVDSPVEGLLWSAAAAPLGGVEESVDRVVAALLDGDPARRLVAPPAGLEALEWHAEYRPDLVAGTLFVTAHAGGGEGCGVGGPWVEEVLASLTDHGPTDAALATTRRWVASEHQRSSELASALAERLAVDRALLGRWDVEAARLRALAGVTAGQVRARARAIASSPWRATVVAREAGEGGP
jgi:predicted Zn-dependent peptidase